MGNIIKPTVVNKLHKLVFTLLLLSSCKDLSNPGSSPTVLTLDPSEIKLNSFILNGEVTDEGFNAAKERGFVWSNTNTNPSVSDNKINVGYGKGPYSHTLEKLSVNTTYYYKAFATNDKGTSYGELKTVKTADYLLAKLTTDLPKNITYTSAELGGNVIEDGGIAVTEKGVCLAIEKTPTIDDIKIVNGKGIGPFANIVIQLKDGSNYAVRSYAINGKGIAYGNEQKFTTNAIKLPTVSTNTTQNISTNLATLFGNISDNGGAEIIEKGFCLSKNPNPSVSDIKVKSSNNDLGNYALVVTALEPATKYYFKAYAQNVKGISYGEESAFTTLQATIPSVVTNDIQEITINSARAGVEIISNGGADITEFGVCISNNRNPTIFDRKFILGTTNSAGKMDYLNGLNNNTTYFIRGYAINRAGVGYGQEKTFTTSNSTQNNIKSGLIAYFPFNGNAIDASGNGNNGNVIGAALTSNRFGKSNSAYYFSSINCSPRIEAIVNTTSITKSLTISIWVKQVGNGCALSPRILDFASSPIDGPGQLQWMFSYQNSWSVSQQKSNRTDINSAIFPTGPYVWTHLVYVNDGITCRYYQDGKLVGTTPNGSGNPILARELTIGRMNHPAYDAFDGNIDDLGVWNRALTEEEVKYLFENDFNP